MKNTKDERQRWLHDRVVHNRVSVCYTTKLNPWKNKDAFFGTSYYSDKEDEK